jgi:hypothetical protein
MPKWKGYVFGKSEKTEWEQTRHFPVIKAFANQYGDFDLIFDLDKIKFEFDSNGHLACIKYAGEISSDCITVGRSVYYHLSSYFEVWYEKGSYSFEVSEARDVILDLEPAPDDYQVLYTYYKTDASSKHRGIIEEITSNEIDVIFRRYPDFMNDVNYNYSLRKRNRLMQRATHEIEKANILHDDLVKKAEFYLI